MQNETARVNDAYRPSGQALEFCTVGFRTSGIDAYVLETAGVQASMELPATAGGATVDLRENIEEARALYAEAAARGEESVALPLLSAGPGGLRERDVVFPHPMNGLVSAQDDYALRAVDRSFSALDASALAGAFAAAVDVVLGIEYHSPVNQNAAAPEDPADRFNMEDDLGAFMDVKRVEGILFNGRLLDGSKAAQAAVTALASPWDLEANEQLSQVLSFLQLRYGMDWWSAYSLISDAADAGQTAWSADGSFSNYAAYYVDADHQLTAGEGAGVPIRRRRGAGRSGKPGSGRQPKAWTPPRGSASRPPARPGGGRVPNLLLHWEPGEPVHRIGRALIRLHGHGGDEP